MSKEQLSSHRPEQFTANKEQAAERPRSVERDQPTPETPKDSPEAAREAVEQALTQEDNKPQEKAAPAQERRSPIISNKRREQAFTHNMSEVRAQMSGPSRAFSKIIHNRAVEDTSEVVGDTVARPTSILTGSICAFLALLIVYLLAKHNGFQLSGFEFIGLFALGWVVGLFIDFLRHMITGK